VRTSKQWRVQGGDKRAAVNLDVSGVAFDEIVVGEWLHVEAMDDTAYYMYFGDTKIWFWVDKKNRVHVTHVEGDEKLIAALTRKRSTKARP
jgi:hypothetical protein